MCRGTVFKVCNSVNGVESVCKGVERAASNKASIKSFASGFYPSCVFSFFFSNLTLQVYTCGRYIIYIYILYSRINIRRRFFSG